MDYYQIFGVKQAASQTEIKKAYRLLAKLYHPDKNQGNAKYEAELKQINFIYDILSDPIKRTHYDQLLAIKNKPKESSANKTNSNNKTTNTSSSTNSTKSNHQYNYKKTINRGLDFFLDLISSSSIVQWLFVMLIFYIVGSVFDNTKKDKSGYREEVSLETGDIKFNNQDAAIRVDSAASYDVLVDSAVAEPKTGDIKF